MRPRPDTDANPAGAAGQPSPLLSVVLPTYNERENVQALIASILEVMGSTPVEVIVVDDRSPDGTAEAVSELARVDPRVRLLTREGKQGLASAVFAGAEAARGQILCVMDADLSHDAEELPGMLAKAQEGFDAVIGSRFVRGAAFVGQPLGRRIASALLNLGTRAVLQLPQRDVLTGYVVCRRELVTELPTHYSKGGFKWLVELLATQRRIRVYEWPIVFHHRHAGSSKADVREAASFAFLCLRLTLWRVRRTVGLRRGGLRSP